MLQEGTIAPDFELVDQNNKKHQLSSYNGNYVLLYFYPKDDTPGCTMEACNIRDNYSAFKKSKLIVLGISSDTPESHTKFAKKYALPFTLLADPNKGMIKAYDAGGIFTKRISYLIGPNREILKRYAKVDPKTHATDVLKDYELTRRNKQ
ncbi:MAG: peroxiredoxin [Candidatus Woesearchaeota archaeon]